MRFNLAAAAGFAAVGLPAPQLPPEQAQPAELLPGSSLLLLLLSLGRVGFLLLFITAFQFDFIS